MCRHLSGIVGYWPENNQTYGDIYVQTWGLYKDIWPLTSDPRIPFVYIYHNSETTEPSPHNIMQWRCTLSSFFFVKKLTLDML